MSVGQLPIVGEHKQTRTLMNFWTGEKDLDPYCFIQAIPCLENTDRHTLPVGQGLDIHPEGGSLGHRPYPDC